MFFFIWEWLWVKYTYFSLISWSLFARSCSSLWTSPLCCDSCTKKIISLLWHQSSKRTQISGRFAGPTWRRADRSSCSCSSSSVSLILSMSLTFSSSAFTCTNSPSTTSRDTLDVTFLTLTLWPNSSLNAYYIFIHEGLFDYIQSYPWVSAALGLGPSQALSVVKFQALAVRQHKETLTNNTVTLHLTNGHIRPMKGNKSYVVIHSLLTLELIEFCLRRA